MIRPFFHLLCDRLLPQICGIDTLNIVASFAFVSFLAAAVFLLLFYAMEAPQLTPAAFPSACTTFSTMASTVRPCF